MDINQQQTEFLQSLDGLPTPEQAAQLLELGQGDTGATTPDAGGAPSVATGADASAAPTEPTKQDGAPTPGEGADATPQGGAAKPDPDKAVILAKDGVHTIGYEKLVEAREDAKTWRQKAEEAERQIAALTAQQQAAAAAPTATATASAQEPTEPAPNAGAVDMKALIREHHAAMVNGEDDKALELAERIQAENRRLAIEQARAEVNATLAPLQQRQATDATAQHFAAILAKHPDLDSLAESQELRSFIDAQPSFVRDSYDAVLKQGTAAQVIELFDRFKEATGRNAPASAPSPASVKAAAAAAIAKAAAPAAPASLSDIPGGKPGGAATREEQWQQMDGVALAEAMAEASPDQIERFLNRRV